MASAGFNGLTVAAFESRMAAEMTRLIERHGGKPLVAPALREIPLEDNSAALQFGELLLDFHDDPISILSREKLRDIPCVLPAACEEFQENEVRSGRNGKGDIA